MQFKTYEKLLNNEWVIVEFETLKVNDRYRIRGDTEFEYTVLGIHYDEDGIFGVRVEGFYI